LEKIFLDRYNTYNLYLIETTNALGQSQKFGYSHVNATYDEAIPGLLRETRNPNGFWTYYFYDPFGRLHKVFRGWNEQGADFSKPSEVYAYYDYGPNKLNDGPFLISSWRKTQDNAAQWSNGGTWERSFYDGFGNQIQVQRPHTDWYPSDGSSGGLVLARHEVVTDTQYDALGRPISQSEPYFRNAYVNATATGFLAVNPYQTPDTSVARTTTDYNAAGQPVRTVG